MSRLLVGFLCSVLLSHGAIAASWFDALPADDPDVVIRHNSPEPLSPPPPPAATRFIYGATVGVASSIIGGIGAIVSGTREALWETAYMFGMNGMPAQHKEITDRIPDLGLPPDAGDSAPDLGTQRPTDVTSNNQQAAKVRTKSVTATPPSAVVAEEAGAQPIDPGLLANFVFDRGDRRPDGTFLVPKSCNACSKFAPPALSPTTCR
jgi:hypothetical protein